MSAFSEKELLLLSNYLYFDKCTAYETVNDMLNDCRGADGIISEEKAAALGIGGCMSSSDGCRILNDMDGCSDGFKSLRVVRSIDEGGIRAICFQSSDGNAAVVFRGTGGSYEAWADNVRGEYLSDTDIQKLADDFIRYDCGSFDDITVAGHSKGGNLAQYVTVLNPERVNGCVSFDGQGFGQEFINRYDDSIACVRDRIKSVSAHNDYVNILLNPIASERIYVKNRYSDAVGCHSSYALYDSCEFDDSGNIVNTAGQSWVIKDASAMLSAMTSGIDRLPDDGSRTVSEFLAANVASIFSSEMSDEYESSMKAAAGRNVLRYLGELSGLAEGEDNGYVWLITDEVYVDTRRLKEAAELLHDIHRSMEAAAGNMAEIRLSIDYRAASRLAVDVILYKAEEDMERYAKLMLQRAVALDQIIRLYSEREASITRLTRTRLLC
ncbi:MAG: DUF2974 domain-containing protein [Lachnospiraceae bacterium]|nr:DUF2974 domain-containing protein [Lachnospiraceae bacterium]